MTHRLRPAAFLDRDGTIMVEVGYPDDPEQVILLPGAAGAVAALRDAGYLVAIVTNQSGIARGLYGLAEFEAVQRRMEQELEAAGTRVDAVYHCPHHPDFSGPCDCRKPATGLYRRAAVEHGLDLASSVFIGDRVSDVLPALEFGGSAYLVRTGYGESEAARVPQGVEVVEDLAAAARAITVAGVDTRTGRQ